MYLSTEFYLSIKSYIRDQGKMKRQLKYGTSEFYQENNELETVGTVKKQSHKIPFLSKIMNSLSSEEKTKIEASKKREKTIKEKAKEKAKEEKVKLKEKKERKVLEEGLKKTIAYFRNVLGKEQV